MSCCSDTGISGGVSWGLSIHSGNGLYVNRLVSKTKSLIACYDGFAVSWNIDSHPDAELVNITLDMAVRTLNNERPIVHNDRGCHYRWPRWITRANTFGLTRSMSKKGCSPDNCIKGYSLLMFIDYLNGYIKWYNEKRTKNSFGFCSPMEFRQIHGYAV